VVLIDERRPTTYELGGCSGLINTTPALGRPGAGGSLRRTARTVGHYDPSGSIVQRMFGGGGVRRLCGRGCRRERANLRRRLWL